MILPVFENHQRQIGLINLKLNSFIQNKTKDQWDDLQMGDLEFFNTENFYWPHLQNNDNSQLVEIYRNRVRRQSHLNIVPCIKQNKYFFKELHTLEETEFYRKVWPNSQLIVINNTQDYLNQRYGRNDIITNEIDHTLFNNYQLFNCPSFLNWKEFEQEYNKLLQHLELEAEHMEDLQSFYKRYIDYWFGA
jgi:hypothetical protein